MTNPNPVPEELLVHIRLIGRPGAVANVLDALAHTTTIVRIRHGQTGAHHLDLLVRVDAVCYRRHPLRALAP